ncbi:MAG TPA: ribosome-associated translation inhibitor RaiA [bacterium]|nr:ribosome-associated translation inhibitor RaiA [bacterium]
MKINIRTREIDLTDAIRAYAEKKLLSLVKFSPDILIADVELAKISKHHKKGDVFSARVTLSVPGKVYRVEEIEPVLYKAIDKAKDDLKQSLNRNKGKSRVADRKNHKVVADDLLSVNEI